MRKIKLFLSLLMVMLLSVGNVWATDFTLSSAAEVSQNGITVSFAKGSGSTAPAWYAAGLRLYASNTITITCDKDITEVTFDWEKQGSKTFASVTASVGDYTHPSNTGEGTWSGTSKSITFTLGSSGQLQLNTFSVTTASGGTPTCATPTFDPEDGEKFDESIDVEINAEDGATIYYTTDGNAPTTSSSVYSTALHFTETITLKAMAVKAGSNNSAVATATYTKIVTVPGYAIDFESELDAYVDWEFSNIGIRTSTITAHGGTYYGSNVNGNGNATATAAIKTKAKVATPGVLTFYISKESNNTTASSWKAQVSADGSEWTDVETFDAKSMSKGTWNECTADLSEYSNVYVRIYYEGSNAIRAIDDIELAEAAAVAKPAISGETPFLTSTMVTLTQAEADHIYYTTNGNEPTASSTEYTVPFELNATATVKAIAVKGSSESAVAEATFTKITPLTVAEAIAAIPNVDDVVNSQYVAGIVCTAGTSVNASGQMTYYISADGSEGTRLQIYLGKNINNTAFSSVSDLAIGDRVVVFGQLKNYKGTYEMNSGNYLVSKEGPAVATPVFDPNGGGFMGETDVTITCATASSTIYYTLDGTTPTKSSNAYSEPIHINATTTITAIAYVGEEHSIVVAKEFTLTAPMTVAEACSALNTQDPINNAAVSGIVYNVTNISSGHATYWISDDGTDTGDVLEVYNGYGLNGAAFAAGGIQEGDEVTVFGNLTIFQSTTKEFSAGSRLLVFNRPVVAVTSIDLTESTAEVEEGKTVTLHASVVPANATNKTIVWSVQSGDDYASVDENGVVTGIAAGEAVIRAASDEDATLFAECTVTVTEPAPLSPWASVYTSNVELSGSQNVKVTITVDEEDKNFDGVKMNKAAAATFTIPAGTTNLYAHMAAWNGEAQTVTVSGDCFDADKSIDIVADANISGSGTTYDIDDAKAPTDYFKEIVLDKEVTEPTEITITAASGKRFVLFGVNQVGGLVLESIAISGTATELEYNEGDHFDPAGLKVMGHYSDNSDAEITEGIDWAFDPDPLTQGTTSVSVTATAGGFTSAAFVVEGLTVAGAAPLSPWATVYTSNVELSGSQNVKVTITVDEEDKNFDGVKMNKAAAATFTIPAGTTNLYAHMAAWNGEAQTVTVSGDCFDADKSIDIVADANISGSGTTYDIDDAKAPTDYFKEIVLDKEVTEPTEITITAASGKRFVLFGVNQVGGVLPVLKSIEISGDLTNKSGYKVGDDLDLDGLTVSAIYTLNDVDQAPVDVTSLVNWSYDPLIEGQTSVTITATLEDKSDDITISDLEAVASADPKIYVEPSLTVNFGSVEVGEAVPANKTITVTLTNVAAATATLGGTNPEAFNIDKTALVEGENVITISVIASTAAAASYSATITITDNAAAATEKVVNLSFAVTEPVVEETPIGTDTKWVAAEAADIKDGAVVLITGVKDDVTYAIGVQNDNNRAAVAGTLDEGVFTPGENTMAFTLVAQEGGTFALRASNGEYLYAASSSKNYLKRQATIDDNAKWTLTATSAVANGTNTHNDLKFNGTNSPKIFSCYGSPNTQTAIQFYVPKQDTPEPPTPDYGSYERDVTNGNYGTICLPKAGTISGATLYEIGSFENNMIYVDEVLSGELEAGKPYIFQATSEQLNVTYTSSTVEETAGHANGLYGFYNLENENAQFDIEENAGNYILYSNAYWLVKGREAYIANYRAYIKISEINAQAPAPGRRRVAMAVHGEQVATGMENVQGDNVQCTKVLINGQLFILRGEKMYDVKGQLVK